MTAPRLQLIEDLEQAIGNRKRAEILLRCPDAIMLSHGHQMGAECRRHDFEAGWEFCMVRHAALSAMHDVAGLLPGPVAAELELWRIALSRFAAGEGAVDQLFGG